MEFYISLCQSMLLQQNIPLSEYAFATKENELIVRLRTGKNSVKEVVLAYGDTACRKENVEFFFIKMIKKGYDHNFDYYEARIINSFPRVVYYFELIDYKDEKHQSIYIMPIHFIKK